VPVASQDSLLSLRDEADEVVCLDMPENFDAVGQFYDDFHDVKDAEVIALLQKAHCGAD
jgi:predicted phosphoribosyltransferase